MADIHRSKPKTDPTAKIPALEGYYLRPLSVTDGMVGVVPPPPRRAAESVILEALRRCRMSIASGGGYATDTFAVAATACSPGVHAS